MKGKTKIILTNVETGEQEIHEDNNLVTNALDKLINIEMAMNQTPNTNILPIATKALGGIMLFDDELTEDADNISFPVEAHLVGYAGQSVNTSDVNRGSYNSAESGKTEDGYVCVWDFGTSQCNGTIRSIARTSARAGENPIWYMFGPSDHDTQAGCPSTDPGWAPIRYDGEYIYLLKIDASTHTARLARTKIPMFKFGVADYSDVARTYEIIASWNTKLFTYTYWNNAQHSLEYSQDVYADDVYHYEDGHDGYIYCVCYNVTNQRPYNDYNYDISYFTIKYSDGSYEKSQTHALQSGTSTYAARDAAQEVYRPNRQFGHVHNGVLYRLSNDRKSIWKIPLSNVSAASSTRIISSGSNDYIAHLRYWMSEAGVIYFPVYHYTESSYNYLGGIYYPDGEFLVNNVSYTGQGDYLNNLGSEFNNLRTFDDCMATFRIYWNQNYTTIYRNWSANYLGTINNLETAITKTSAQTMKIVYTLTDIDDASEDTDDD